MGLLNKAQQYKEDKSSKKKVELKLKKKPIKKITKPVVRAKPAPKKAMVKKSKVKSKEKPRVKVLKKVDKKPVKKLVLPLKKSKLKLKKPVVLIKKKKILPKKIPQLKKKVKLEVKKGKTEFSKIKKELLKDEKKVLDFLKPPGKKHPEKKHRWWQSKKKEVKKDQPSVEDSPVSPEIVDMGTEKVEEEQKEEVLVEKETKVEDVIQKRRAKEDHANHTQEERREKYTELKKFKVGIKGFDDLFRNGIPEGAAVLVEGGPGSGKTLFCLQLAYAACMQGKKVLYMTFEEPVRRLRHHMKSFGWHPEKHERGGKLLIKKFNSLDVARSVEALLSEAKRELLIDIQPILIPKEFKPDIVCIDSLSSISSAFSGEDARFRVYIEQLFRYLESHDITSFLIRETSHPTHLGASYTETSSAVSFLSDGIIVWYNVVNYDGTRGRAIEVLKMRGEDIDRRIVHAEIVDKKGIIVYPNQQLKIKQEKGSYKLT
ncbi:AAA family ATPase [Candidatus Woesearchaeota archaeon]|nr:AAA family ATPase [Candidatus Woesearchaeota archaeon]